VNSLLTAFHAIALEQAVLLRTLLVATCWTALLALWTRPVPMFAAAVLGMVSAALVLRAAFPAFLLVNLLALWVAHRLEVSGHRWRRTVVALVTLVVLFVIARHRGWDVFLLKAGRFELTLFYLDMWMLLRLVVLFWEVGAGRQQAPALVPFIAWCTNPLFLAGPLFRSSRWPESIGQRRDLLCDAGWWVRIGTGLVMLAGGIALAAVARSTRVGAVPGPVTKALVLFFLGPWSFYWTIAGAFLFLAALGEIHGMFVGPSFDRPFFQSNIADFWARWNMTATTVFREVLFYNRWGFSKFNPYVNTMVVFFAVGLWHGSNLYWISFGLLHGCYFCAYLWFRSWSGRTKVAIPRWSAVLLTYVCVCTAWYLPSKFVGLLFR